MVLFGVCFVPCTFGGALCLLGGLRVCGIGASKVHDMYEVDDCPRKMSDAEIEMYNLHLSAYGGNTRIS